MIEKSSLYQRVKKGLKDNPAYFLSWIGGGIGSNLLAAGTSYYMQELGGSNESIATGTWFAKHLGFYTINLGLQTVLKKNSYNSSKEWSNEMKNLTKSNIAGVVVNSALGWTLHDLFMNCLDIKNPQAALIAYPISGLISTGVKFGLDIKNKIVKVKKQSLEEKVQS